MPRPSRQMAAAATRAAAVMAALAAAMLLCGDVLLGGTSGAPPSLGGAQGAFSALLSSKAHANHVKHRASRKVGNKYQEELAQVAKGADNDRADEMKAIDALQARSEGGSVESAKGGKAVKGSPKHPWEAEMQNLAHSKVGFGNPTDLQAHPLWNRRVRHLSAPYPFTKNGTYHTGRWARCTRKAARYHELQELHGRNHGAAPLQKEQCGNQRYCKWFRGALLTFAQGIQPAAAPRRRSAAPLFDLSAACHRFVRALTARRLESKASKAPFRSEELRQPCSSKLGASREDTCCARLNGVPRQTSVTRSPGRSSLFSTFWLEMRR